VGFHVLVDLHLVRMDSLSKAMAQIRAHPHLLGVIRIEMDVEAVAIITKVATEREADLLIKTVAGITTGTTITGITTEINQIGIIEIITKRSPANFSLNVALVVTVIIADTYTIANLLDTR